MTQHLTMTLQRLSNVYAEWIAVGGAGFAWVTVLHGVLDPVLLILSVSLTLCSLILVIPKVIKEVKSWFIK